MLASDVSSRMRAFLVFQVESNSMMSFSLVIINCLVAGARFSLVDARVL